MAASELARGEAVDDLVDEVGVLDVAHGFLEGLDALELAVAQVALEALGEPGDAAVDLVDGVAVVALRAHEVEEAAEGVKLFGLGGLWRQFFARGQRRAGEADFPEVRERVAEDPGCGEGAAADHDAAAAGGAHHAFGVDGLAHVAVADDGDGAVDGVDDAGDAGELNDAAELHLGGAAVDCDGDDADIGEHAGQVGRAGGTGLIVGGVPAEADFACERHEACRDWGLGTGHW